MQIKTFTLDPSFIGLTTTGKPNLLSIVLIIFFSNPSSKYNPIGLKRVKIEKISNSLRSNNYTLIPLDLHFNSKGFLKVDLSISKGRKKADLREYKKQQDWKKEKHKL